jgi:acyl-coenzyme A synthetase/AMP-(fatty) acid ligase
MSLFGPPTIVTRTRVWSADELTAIACHWWAALSDLTGRAAPAALVMANDPLSVAQFFAHSALPGPLILLSPDPRSWRTSPPVPSGTPLVLRPSQSSLADAGLACGFDVRILPEAAVRGGGKAEPAPFFQSPGIVIFTSGSTGVPRPVYRLMASALDCVRFRIAALGLSPASHVVGSLPLDRSAAVSEVLLMPAMLGSRLALVETTDYRSLLDFFATGDYEHWTSTPAIADVLVRAVRGRHRAPSSCLSAGRVGSRLFDAFLDAFSVPLRGYYGATESPWIAVDTRPAGSVRAGVVGPPASAVDLRIGARPDEAVPSGTTGRIWVKSPWTMAGYGFPPSLEPRTDVDGWWGTPDMGRIEADGSLSVIGRIDDTVRTSAGQLVNLGVVATALLAAPGVRDAVAAPIDAPDGSTVIAALAEVDPGVSALDLCAHLEAALPPGSTPRVLETTSAIPRLSDGRPDRRAVIEFLRESR